MAMSLDLPNIGWHNVPASNLVTKPIAVGNSSTSISPQFICSTTAIQFAQDNVSSKQQLCGQEKRTKPSTAETFTEDIR